MSNDFRPLAAGDLSHSRGTDRCFVPSIASSCLQSFHYDERGNVVPFEPEPLVPPPAPVEPYCWEEGGDEDAPLTKRFTHTMHWAGTSVLSGMEMVGEVFADFFGLNQSKFQWIIDQKEREDEERRERRARRAARREQAAAAAAAGAASAADALEAGSPLPATASAGAPAQTSDQQHGKRRAESPVRGLHDDGGDGGDGGSGSEDEGGGRGTGGGGVGR